MNRLAPRLAACLALALVLICAALSAVRPAAPSAATAPASAPDGAAVDPGYIYDKLAYLSTHFLHREAGYDTGLPPDQNGHDEFADYWSQEALRDLQGFGAVARRDPFAIAGWDGLPAPVSAFNVEVTVPGVEHPEQMVIVGCHYDGEHDSTQSAYDDASGCAIALGVARALGAYWRASGLYPARTLRLVLFDGEEQGVRGSLHYLNQTIGGELGDVVAMFNEEQNGIAYPLRFLGKASNPPLPLHVQLAPLTDNVFYPDVHALPASQRDHIARFRDLAAQALPAAFLALQRSGNLWLQYHGDGDHSVTQPVFTPDQMANVQYFDDYQGGSDQVPFTEAGIPAVTFSGNNTYYSETPDPWSYPFDRPDDTIQLMNTYASGQPGASPSLALALALPATLTVEMLRQPDTLGAAPVAGGPLAAIGDLTPARPGVALQLDAAAFDPRGGPLTYAWDFGDGSTASGASVRHTYATAGAYGMTLTVTSPAGTTRVRKTLAVAANGPSFPNPYATWPHSGAPPRNPLVTLPVVPAPADATPSPPATGDRSAPPARAGAGSLGWPPPPWAVAALAVLLAAAWLFVWRRRVQKRGTS